MKKNNTQISLLAQYFALSYLLLLINASAFLRQIHYINFISSVFAAIVFLAYCFIYIIPIFLTLNISKNIIDNRLHAPAFLKSPWFTGIPAIIALTILQLLIYIDSFIFQMFGFHFNGFVWNLIFTKGGVESMGSSQSTMNSFIIRVVFFLAAQSILFILLLKIQKIRFSLFCPDTTKGSDCRTVADYTCSRAGYGLRHQFILQLSSCSDRRKGFPVLSACYL